MKTPGSNKKNAQRKKPAPAVVRKIYARAAGRCLLCKNQLLESNDLGTYSFNMGEMAHIVGQSLDASSPRSDFELAKEFRDEDENFLLLCPKCHQTIDSAATRGDFTVEWLRGWKKDQEAHIEHVTGLPQSHRTCIVRLVGSIRGKGVQITPAECNTATLHHSTPRFAFFPLAFGRQEVEIDLVVLGEPEENPDQYWASARLIINQRLQTIREGIERGEIEHLSIFGFARIPVLAFFGFAIGNKVGSTLFQRRRVDSKPWQWIQEGATQAFEWSHLQKGLSPRCVALVLNVSGTIQREELPAAIDEQYSIFVIRPFGVDPQPDAILTEASLDAFRLCYRRWLAYLETSHKSAHVIHVFAAVPAAVAISIGSDLMPHTQPELLIYDRTPREFRPALSINAQY
ncbi:SAVED domain-containing protein [Hymenobacter siberiensis]|uniref:SAVED domain-containing protein n=1 Tax=Hymenobacter siberiensis TaxID=2848396 RepID=UPI001C1DF49F|nr:SAVED domain-containing protein [Hymenobacter siberiensis]MBU6122607.1 SAVED domain-containing protein [Hymenobacter siberiensis]